MMNRRGFLQTMIAAAVTAAAQFDPTKGLWVPGGPAIAADETWYKSDAPLPKMAMADDIQELHTLALRFAQALGEQMRQGKVLVLNTVMAERAGHINLGLIRLENGDVGEFVPLQARTLTYLGHRSPEDAAWRIGRDLRDIDVFAPIGADLRAGVPFSNDVQVGVATDPESGISARAVRFTTIHKETQTQLEVAGGSWDPYRYSRGRSKRVPRLDSAWSTGIDLGNAFVSASTFKG